MNKPITQITISVLLVIILMTGAFFIVTKKPNNDKITIEHNDLQGDSNIVSIDPMRTAAKFIEANGTMGNIETDITQETMKTDEATYSNGTRRLKALEKVEKALVPGNLLLLGNERDNIKNFVRNLDYPFLYETRNIEVSKPSDPEKLTVYTVNGPVEYESVTVKVDFESARIYYSCPKDITYAGIHQQLTNVEKFENVEVVLVRSGDLWFVYNIINAEKVINERFATWSGTSPSTIDYSKNVETGIFVLKDFIPPEIPDEENPEENGEINSLDAVENVLENNDFEMQENEIEEVGVNE